MSIIDEYKRQGKEIENEVEKNFDRLQEIQASLDPNALEVVVEGQQPESKVIENVAVLLKRLQQTAVEIREIASSRTDSAYASQFFQKHQELTTEFNRLKEGIRTTRQKNELMGHGSGEDTRFTNVLLKEQSSLENSLSTSEAILDAGREIRASFGRQKDVMTQTQTKVVTFAETLPGINVLLSKIEKRKRFNAIVYAIAISISLCVIMYLMFQPHKDIMECTETFNMVIERVIETMARNEPNLSSELLERIRMDWWKRANGHKVAKQTKVEDTEMTKPAQQIVPEPMVIASKEESDPPQPQPPPAEADAADSNEAVSPSEDSDDERDSQQGQDSDDEAANAFKQLKEEKEKKEQEEALALEEQKAIEERMSDIESDEETKNGDPITDDKLFASYDKV